MLPEDADAELPSRRKLKETFYKKRVVNFLKFTVRFLFLPVYMLFETYKHLTKVLIKIRINSLPKILFSV